MPRATQFAISLVLASALAGCAGARPGVITGAVDPGDILVVYHHGSAVEANSDRCRPTPDGAFADDVSLPPVLAELDHLPGIAVRAVCSSTLGDYEATRFESVRTIPCTPNVSEPVPARFMKVCKRVARMRAWLAATLSTVPRDRLFFAGTSAGAWASLLIDAAPDRPFNAVIGFAPAFAGTTAVRRREPPLLDARARHLAFFESRSALPALVFAFDGDPYEAPGDETGLARLRAVPGFNVVAFDAAGPCSASPHLCARSTWFAPVALPLIRSYIACRVADPEDACAAPPP
ncbi:MAG: hypothetical protein WD673_13390 [Alphaproteobacteria bacterium]